VPFNFHERPGNTIPSSRKRYHDEFRIDYNLIEYDAVSSLISLSPEGYER
jgi:hypothetical protein